MEQTKAEPPVATTKADPSYALTVEDLCCCYGRQDSTVLDGIGLVIGEGERVGLLGPSGAGKTTLLKCINQLIRPVSGRVLVGDQEIWSADQRSEPVQQRLIGMIFQDYALSERQSALDNVLVGCLGRTATLPSLLGLYPREQREFAWHCLEKVGLADHALHRADELSGGERQRVAIARVLAQKPRIVLADEPVSSLDPPLQRRAMELLVTICQQENMTLLASMHALDLVKAFTQRALGLQKGCLIFDGGTDALTGDLIEAIYVPELRHRIAVTEFLP
jgi:phosphonate transport system ATP-binding protein